MPEPKDQFCILVISEETFRRLLVESDSMKKTSDLSVPTTAAQSVAPKKELVSERIAKEMLGRSTSTLWRYTSTHQLTKIKKLGRNYYIKEEIERLLNEYPDFSTSNNHE